MCQSTALWRGNGGNNMADNIVPTTDGWATYNMKPSGGGDEEANALWARYIAANEGCLYRLGMYSPIFSQPNFNCATNMTNGTISEYWTVGDNTVRTIFNVAWYHSGSTQGTLAASGRFWHVEGGAGNFYATFCAKFNGTDMGTVIVDQTSPGLEDFFLPIPTEITGIKYLNLYNLQYLGNDGVFTGTSFVTNLNIYMKP